MTNPEDLLQERLERLEAGETLEACLEGAPYEIATSLKTAACLSAVELPVRNPEKVAAQRSVVTKALEKKSSSIESASKKSA